MIKILTNMKLQKKQKRYNLNGPWYLPWLFILPTVILLLFVVAGPTLGTVGLAFFKWDGLGKAQYVGITNFINLFKDPVFYKALFNNFKWLIYFCTVPVVFGLINALLITKIAKSQRLYRTILFLPYVCSTVVTAMIWKWIYDPFFGLNPTLLKYGISGLPNWLSDTKVALFSVAITDSWRYVGFLMILFLTGLSQTDKQLEEASKIDGANGIQTFIYIILPQLRSTIVLILMLTMIWSFAAFDYVYVMTGGGPGRATELLATYMYSTTIQGQSAGYGSSISCAMLFFSIIIIAVFGILKKKGWDI